MKPKTSYGIGKIYSAQIRSIKKDKVFFEIKLLSFFDFEPQEIIKKAAFFIKIKNFNPYTSFKIGETIDVKVIRLFNHKENACLLDYEVVPCILPADEYIKTHPVGSTVQGKIDTITGATMTIFLAPNVYALTKRSKHAHTGQIVDCKIDKFHNQKISLRVF